MEVLHLWDEVREGKGEIMEDTGSPHLFKVSESLKSILKLSDMLERVRAIEGTTIPEYTFDDSTTGWEIADG